MDLLTELLLLDQVQDQMVLSTERHLQDQVQGLMVQSIELHHQDQVLDLKVQSTELHLQEVRFKERHLQDQALADLKELFKELLLDHLLQAQDHLLLVLDHQHQARDRQLLRVQAVVASTAVAHQVVVDLVEEVALAAVAAEAPVVVQHPQEEAEADANK